MISMSEFLWITGVILVTVGLVIASAMIYKIANEKLKSKNKDEV